MESGIGISHLHQATKLITTGIAWQRYVNESSLPFNMDTVTVALTNLTIASLG